LPPEPAPGYIELNGSKRFSLGREMENRIDTKTSRMLVLFSFAMFVQTTTALSVIGVLPALTAEWGVPPERGALLVTAFGATFALSAPVLQMLVGHWVRRTQILIGLSVMTAGAVAFSLAPAYGALFAARVVMGLGAALLSPVLLALATRMVAPRQQGAALAVVSMGISIATVIGVPMSSWLASHAGPRALYGAIALLLASTAAAIALFTRDASQGERVSARQAWALLRRPATIGGLLVIFLITSGLFSTYAMITPILRDAYGAGPRAISAALFLYGVSGLMGNFFVRSASARWSAEALLRGAMIVLMAIFASLLALPVSLPILLIGMVAWPFVADIVWPSQQRRMVELEPAFRGIALALSSSFLFLGMGFGSAVGGAAYAAHGLGATLAASIILIGLGLGALAFSMRAARLRAVKASTAAAEGRALSSAVGAAAAETAAAAESVREARRAA
jgi:predicted MFS family arabinose efflux permease